MFRIFQIKKRPKPEINYPSKGNVVENIIYGTITKMARLSENLTIISLIFHWITLLIRRRPDWTPGGFERLALLSGRLEF